MIKTTDLAKVDTANEENAQLQVFKKLYGDEEVIKLKNEIVMNHDGIMNYSSDVSKKLTDFSSELLSQVKLKDSPEVESMLMKLLSEIQTIDGKTLTEKKVGFFQKKKKGIEKFIARYESISSFVTDITNNLSMAEFTLSKDVRICDTYIEQNKEYIKELDNHIAAGLMRVEEEKANIEKERLEMDNNDPLAVQELTLKEAEISRLERKLHNMQLQRVIAIQNIPQLMLIKDGDSVLIEKIHSGIETVIPLWQSQILITIQTMRQQAGVKLTKSMTDTTNEVLRTNADLLNQSSVGVAKELERDIVDVDTLMHVNERLISTIKDIKNIQEEGKQKRKQASKELIKIQSELNSKLLLEQQGQ